MPSSSAKKKPQSIIRRASDELAMFDYSAFSKFIKTASLSEAIDSRSRTDALKQFAHDIRDYASERTMAVSRSRSERRAGKWLKEMAESGERAKRGGDRRSKYPNGILKLDDLGITLKQSSHWQKIYAMPDEDFEEALNNLAMPSVLGLLKHVRGTFGTGENEWYTPAEYVELVRQLLGSIDLDPASSLEAQKTVKAESFFTKEDDGLNHDWNGRVYLNPPYAQPAIAQFTDKMVQEWGKGNVAEAVMLTHNYTDTEWFQNAAHSSSALCFPKGRIRFVNSHGNVAAPTQGQAFFYFGANVDDFRRLFSLIGFVKA